MDEKKKTDDWVTLTKLRKEARLIAIMAVALGSGMILVTIGIFAVYGGVLNKAVLSPNKDVADLADTLRWVLFTLIPCNGMAVATAVGTLRYLRAEQRWVDSPAAT